MKARQVVGVGVAAVAGAALVGGHRLRDAQANMRRYSMPSVGVYDLVTGLVFRGPGVVGELTAGLAGALRSRRIDLAALVGTA